MSCIDNFESNLVTEIRKLMSEIYNYESGTVKRVSSEIINHDYTHYCLVCHVIEREDTEYSPYGKFSWLSALKHIRIHLLHMIAYRFEKHEKDLFVNAINESKILDLGMEYDWYFDLSINPYVLVPKKRNLTQHN